MMTKPSERNCSTWASMATFVEQYLRNTQRGPDGVLGKAQLVHMSPGDMEECW